MCAQKRHHHQKTDLNKQKHMGKRHKRNTHTQHHQAKKTSTTAVDDATPGLTPVEYSRFCAAWKHYAAGKDSTMALEEMRRMLARDEGD